MLRPLLLIFLLTQCSFHTPEDTAAEYSSLKSRVESKRKELAALYKVKATRDSALKESRAFLFSMIADSIYRFWEDTDWEFYGMTETPKQGSIACGYFVTTVLRDAGLKINRVELAKTYSEKMIKTLVKPGYVKKYPGDYKAFAKAIAEQGDGIYVVGLDFHTGFIICRNKKVIFMHSNYTSKVMKEPVVESIVLENNKYFVTGNLLADEDLLTKWLLNQAF